MKKKLFIILTAAVLVMSLSACGAKNAKSDKNTKKPAQTEAATKEPAKATEPSSTQNTNPPVESESGYSEPSNDNQTVAENPTDAGQIGKALTEFKSEFGYTISYDEASFNYRRTSGYDEFILKSDTLDKPFVFVCVSSIEAGRVDQIRKAVMGDNPLSCTIGQAQKQSQYVEKQEVWAGGKIIKKTYLYPLDSGAALLIETQSYTEPTDDSYAALLLRMVNSIKM